MTSDELKAIRNLSLVACHRCIDYTFALRGVKQAFRRKRALKARGASVRLAVARARNQQSKRSRFIPCKH
jgi:hypothetical protein